MAIRDCGVRPSLRSGDDSGGMAAALQMMILLVDDDAAIRDSLSNELRAAGYPTTTAVDGADGVRLFRAGPPDRGTTHTSAVSTESRRENAIHLLSGDQE